MSLKRGNRGCDARAVSAARLVPIFLWILLELTDNILLPEIVGNRLEQKGDFSLSDRPEQP